jgi:mannose-6-phosphate isomerase-like protein (cupin superfamily)
MSEPVLRKAAAAGRWAGVELLHYKREGEAPFEGVTRQVLFEDAGGAQWRYFEVAPAGHTTLERHAHTHAVMVLHGAGSCLVGDRIYALGERDLVCVPPLTWHQFRAHEFGALGFLCLVSRERDRPQLPSDEHIAQLRADPQLAAFIRV